jgi:hypothetical protein
VIDVSKEPYTPVRVDEVGFENFNVVTMYITNVWNIATCILVIDGQATRRHIVKGNALNP